MATTRYPILADTSALIALGTSTHWNLARSALKLTTTNVCRTELERHVRNNAEYAPEGSREYRLHQGSSRALDAFDDETAAFSVVTVVPAPSGEDAGEQSLLEELSQHPDPYRYVVLNDAIYRDKLRSYRERNDCSYRVVPPTYLLYVLYDNDRLSKADFCRGCAEMMRGEGWTNAGAVHEMWRAIPVDCSPYVDEDLLPE
ncbi:MAG: hypothetical protein ACOCR6_02530 [archaeon]